ncbi:MAG: spondin domain-containing protein [Actinomycetota bacterium]
MLAACGTDGNDADDNETATSAAAAEDEMSEDEMSDDEMSDDEPTTFTLEIANVSDGFTARQAEVFAVPVGATEPGPATPGSGYEWQFTAAPGERLSFATMFVQSNDWFFAPGAEGIALFDDAGNPITGDVTDQVTLWDSGTEIDQEPGTGSDQAPRQPGPDTGAADPDTAVRLVDDRDPAAYVSVSLAHDGEAFTLSIDTSAKRRRCPLPWPLGSAWSTAAESRSSPPLHPIVARASKRSPKTARHRFSPIRSQPRVASSLHSLPAW